MVIVNLWKCSPFGTSAHLKRYAAVQVMYCAQLNAATHKAARCQQQQQAQDSCCCSCDLYYAKVDSSNHVLYSQDKQSCFVQSRQTQGLIPSPYPDPQPRLSLIATGAGCNRRDDGGNQAGLTCNTTHESQVEVGVSPVTNARHASTVEPVQQ